MNKSRRKHHFSEQKKPSSTAACIFAVLSVVILGIYGYIVRQAILTEGDLPLLYGEISLFLLLASLFLCTEGFRVLQDKVYSLSSRLLGFILPLIAVIVCAFTYLLGLLGH